MTRCLALLVVALLLAGCRGTREIEVGSEGYGNLEPLSELALRQPASVVLRSMPHTAASVKWLRVSDDSLHYRYGDGLAASAPLRDVETIIFRRKVSLLWPAVGGVTSGIAMGLLALSRKDRGGDVLIPDGFTFGAGFGGGFLIGALVGGIVGGVASQPGVVYRFRPDTPQQMSVVIGLGPTSGRTK